MAASSTGAIAASFSGPLGRPVSSATTPSPSPIVTMHLGPGVPERGRRHGAHEKRRPSDLVRGDPELADRPGIGVGGQEADAGVDDRRLDDRRPDRAGLTVRE